MAITSKGQTVIVEWSDSANHALGWVEGVKHRPAKITSVGMVAKVNAKNLTLVQSVCTCGPGRGSVNNAITIPVGCINNVSRLR